LGGQTSPRNDPPRNHPDRDRDRPARAAAQKYGASPVSCLAFRGRPPRRSAPPSPGSRGEGGDEGPE